MHRSRDAGTWNSIRAAGREETKNPPCQSARRVSENLLRNSKSSLAVFYVEQVALNRHVSVRLQSSRLAATAAISFIAEGLGEVKRGFWAEAGLRRKRDRGFCIFWKEGARRCW